MKLMNARDARSSRRRRLGLVALVLGVIFGFSLSSIGLLPVPKLNLGWTVPLLEAGGYVPDSSSEAGEETILVYVGSSTCGWSASPRLYRDSQLRRPAMLAGASG